MSKDSVQSERALRHRQFQPARYAIMVRRYRDLVRDRPAFNNVERWFAAIAAWPAFQEHVLAIPLV
jgi:hypothetical protein